VCSFRVSEYHSTGSVPSDSLRGATVTADACHQKLQCLEEAIPLQQPGLRTWGLHQLLHDILGHTPNLHCSAGSGKVFLSLYTAPTWLPRFFRCLVKGWNVSDVDDFHLTPCTPSSRSFFKSKMSPCTLGTGQSNLVLRLMPQYVWWICGKVMDWCPDITVRFV
jgi:hypothetical protein